MKSILIKVNKEKREVAICCCLADDPELIKALHGYLDSMDKYDDVETGISNGKLLSDSIGNDVTALIIDDDKNITSKPLVGNLIIVKQIDNNYEEITEAEADKIINYITSRFNHLLAIFTLERTQKLN